MFFSTQYRRLLEHDIHSGADLTKPGQVIVSIEFSKFSESVNERALLGGCEVDEDTARIHSGIRLVDPFPAKFCQLRQVAAGR